MTLKQEINLILNHLPSEVMKDKDLKVSLLGVMAKLGQPINRGCPDCYNKAYYRLLRWKQNNYIVEDQNNTYLFRKNLHGYRSKKTGKVLNNHNSTVEERKDVFNTSESHQSLFETDSIPLEEEKPAIKTTRTPRKRKKVKPSEDK